LTKEAIKRRKNSKQHAGGDVKKMIEKGRISALQMWIMLYPTVIATDIITVPAISIKYAGRDLWLSTIWASLVGFLVVYVIDRLNKLYPGQTFIQYCEHILGVLPGKFLGLIYLFYFLFAEGIILREYAEFVNEAFLSHTPSFVIVGGLVFVCACAVRGGVEVIGRSAQSSSLFLSLPFSWSYCSFSLTYTSGICSQSWRMGSCRP
jgi:spore germination protein KB